MPTQGNPANPGMKSELVFAAHLFVTLLAWVAPFLFTWWLLALAYSAVLLQFRIFGRCLMNQHHDLAEEDHNTFYSHLLERLGFRPNRRRLKILVRQYLYPVLAVIAFLWQAGLGIEPLLF